MGYHNYGRIKTIVLPIEIPSVSEGESKKVVMIWQHEYKEKYGIDLKEALGDVNKKGTIGKINDRSLIYLYFDRNEGPFKNPTAEKLHIPQYELIQNSLSDDGVNLTILNKDYHNEYSGDTITLKVEYHAVNASETGLSVTVIPS